MSTTHSCIAQLFTSQLTPAEHHEEESSMDRGRRAQLEAWSLRRLASNLVRRLRGVPVRDEQAELELAVRRLSELSPHLLLDLGIDPETGEMLDEAESHVLRRPVRSSATEPVMAPPAEPVRKPARLRLHIRILPEPGHAAEPVRL
jgi:uncharacterized protein YjiS (DUF1127 family)